MKPALLIATVMALAMLAISCGSGSGPPDEASPPPPEPSPPVSLAGTWSGTGVDSNETNVLNSTPIATTIVTWTLAQTDAGVSGTVTTRSVDPLSSSTCNSCHRTKTGTLSGTIAGTTLTWTMSFPGADSDPTPACTATLTGTVSGIAESSLRGLYSGEDLCEGKFLDGTLTLARQP
jgi:hypothetical protein